MPAPEAVVIAGQRIEPGQRESVRLPLPGLYTHTPTAMWVHVVRGRRAGPRLFVSAAIHGDELNGVEIIRRLLTRSSLKRLRGTLIAVPIVNVFGVIHNSRYLPDRRDLNRAFPGHESGSMAARLAHLFMSEIVAQSTHGIDLHTGAIHRANVPQIRANLDAAETAALACAFGVPVLINAALRDGSLRAAATERGIVMLLYEAGEALRLDEIAIRAGLQGILNTMRALGMLPARSKKPPRREPFMARSSSWTRAPRGGLFRAQVSLGGHVQKGDRLGFINDPFNGSQTEVSAHATGIVIGRTNIALVHEGEALFHIARFEDASQVAEELEEFQSDHDEAIAGDNELPIV